MRFMCKQLLLAAVAVMIMSATAKAQYCEWPGYEEIPGNIAGWNPNQEREIAQRFWQGVLDSYPHLKPFSSFFLGAFSTDARSGLVNIKSGGGKPAVVDATPLCMPRADGESPVLILPPLAARMPYAEEDEAHLWGLEEGILKSWTSTANPDFPALAQRIPLCRTDYLEGK